MATESVNTVDDLQEIKLVSRIKHKILDRYLPAWETILGSRYDHICYYDCYAGPGEYTYKGEKVEGSPVIAVRSAIDFVNSNSTKRVSVTLVERDNHQLKKLEASLNPFKPYPEGVTVNIVAEDANQFIPSLIKLGQDDAPSFYYIEPYGHPLTIPIINKLLEKPRKEALINFMFFKINRDVSNKLMRHKVDEMFGNDDWGKQAFLGKKGKEREKMMLDYFMDRIDAKYKFPFRVRFDPTDKMSSDRTKYYLIHASNHPKATLLMKEVMWPLGDEEGMFDFGGSGQKQLFSQTPSLEMLRERLNNEYSGKTIGFDKLRVQTWDWPHIEKQYREVLREMIKANEATIRRISSVRFGISKLDEITFGGQSTLL